jgi:hypothetical protein
MIGYHRFAIGHLGFGRRRSRARTYGAARALPFALSIIARRGRRGGGRYRWPPMPLASLAFVARREPAGAPLRTSVVLQPRLTVAVSSHLTYPGTPTVSYPVAAARIALAGARILERPAARSAALVVSRLRTREVRVEAMPAPAHTIIATRTSGGVPRLPLVARPAGELSGRSPPDAAHSPTDPRPAAAGPTPPRPIAPAELAMITDTVLRSLDHRIAAQRERLGRR